MSTGICLINVKLDVFSKGLFCCPEQTLLYRHRLSTLIYLTSIDREV